jgi:hypothetical protein
MGICGFTSASDLAVRKVGPIVCPKNTSPNMHTYDTTSTDENGFETSATGYEIQCLDTSGNVAHTDLISFAFIWTGILVAIGLMTAAALALVLATPAGVLINKRFKPKKISHE